MTTDESNHSLPIDPSGLSDPASLRAAADGELSLPDSFFVRDPEARERIAFEQSLRAAVARSMSSDAAPEALRTRIASAFKGAAAPSPVEQLRLVRPEDHPKVYRDRLPFPKQWWLAVAAAVALVTGLLLFNPLGLSMGPPTFARIAAFTTQQHDQCALLSKPFNGKMTVRTEAEAVKAAIEILPKVPSVLELRSDDLAKAGYRFAGLGRCAVPGRGRSVHLVYKADPTIAPGAPHVSLFVQEDTGELAFEPNCAFTNKPSDPDAPAKGTGFVTMWRKDGLIYYLVAPPLPPDARRAFDAPSEERSIL